MELFEVVMSGLLKAALFEPYRNLHGASYFVGAGKSNKRAGYQAEETVS